MIKTRLSTNFLDNPHMPWNGSTNKKKKEKEIAKEDINEQFEFSLKQYQYFLKENEIIVYYIFLAISLLEIFKHSKTKPNLGELIKNFLMS